MCQDFQDKDKLYRYLFQNRAVRGEWVNITQTLQNCFLYNQYPTVVQNLLGEMLVATSLLTATLKFEGDITMQIQGDGALRFAVVNGNNRQQLRALARLNGEVDNQMTLQDMVGKGVLVITLSPIKGERYQGIVELVGNSISASLEQYFMQSEQLLTKLIIKTSGQQAGGILLQVLPNAENNREDFEHLATLAETTTTDELLNLSAHEMLYRLFHEEEVEVFPAEEVCFHCGCSEMRSAHALLMLGEAELKDIFAENNGRITTRCECCGREYIFTSQSLAKFNN